MARAVFRWWYPETGEPEGPQRKRKKTYNTPGDTHYLTFSCVGQLPLLSRDRVRLWLVEAIDKARAAQNMALWAYVIMPEHVHLLVWPREREYCMERFLAACKRPVSWKAKQWLLAGGQTRWLSRLTVQEGGKQVFRFWLPGGGFDKNLVERRGVDAVIAYIHDNPVRRGLVETPHAWKWSSARFWNGERDVPLRMDIAGL